MRRISSTKEFYMIALPAACMDAVASVLAMLLSVTVILDHFPFDALNWLDAHELYFGMPLLALLSYVGTLLLMGVRSQTRVTKYSRVVSRAIVLSVAYAVVDTLLVGVVYDIPITKVMICSFVITGTLVSVVHFSLVVWLRGMRRRGRMVTKVAIVGSGENAGTLYDYFNYNVEMTGFIAVGSFGESDEYNAGHLLGPVSDVDEYVLSHGVQELYCSLSPVSHGDEINRLIDMCDRNFITFYYVPDMDGYVRRRMTFEELGPVNVARFREEPMANPMAKFVKRTFDLVISGLFLCTVFPFVYVAVAIGIKLSSPGPVFFRQKRTGYSGHSFECLKFRSMRVNVDADLVQASEKDPRKTKFGDFLRRSSIDELPQFINVFRGEMSIIGPRPHMEYHTEMYSKLISKYLVRHLVKPGITGWAQIRGYRGETRTLDQMENRIRCDIWYIEHWSLYLDIRIFFETFFQLLRGSDKAF